MKLPHSLRWAGSSIALVLLLIAGQLVVALGMAPPAQAAPGDRPVEIAIVGINPRISAPGTEIEVDAVLMNTIDTPITDLTVRLQRGAVLQTRSDLADNDSDPVEVNDSRTTFQALPEPLAAKGVLPFTYTTTPEALGLTSSGAYPLLINVNGRAGSDPESRVGEQVVLLPYLSRPPTATTQLSWLWPLVAPPERNAAGVFTGTSLVTSLSPGGRLDQALSALEGSPAPNGSAARPRPVTLAVDPELLEAVRVLAGGAYQLFLDGQQQTSSVGSAEAATWLARLGALAARLPVISLPYADPDLATFISQGQGAAVERLLPDASPGDLVEEILGVAPDLRFAWPLSGGAADPAVLDMLAEHGATQVVADETLTFVAQPDGPTLDAVSTIQTLSGPISALTADHVLSGLSRVDTSEPGRGALTEQRFLAELVVIAAEAPTRDRHLLIAAPRDFEPATAGLMLNASSGQPWLGTELLADLAAAVAEPATRTLISPAPNTNVIPGPQLTALLDAMRARDDFASAMSDPDTDLLFLDRALARAATGNRGPNLLPGQAAVLDAVAAVTALRATVGIVPPANGTYSLASADAPLVLTVVNNNPFPVRVGVALAPRGAPGVTTTNMVQELPAQTNTIISIPANVERSGSFTVIATVSTPAGGALGAPVQLQVQSTVYGPVALAITFGAGALLVLLFARRSVKYWRRRRSSAPDDDTTGSKLPVAGDTGPIRQPVFVDPPRKSPV
ncbi:MAG: DUF6049 family protein [Actinomycetota bacterium]|nr:DUF6049 family protein [Actinomycetota bacterium]